MHRLPILIVLLAAAMAAPGATAQSGLDHSVSSYVFAPRDVFDLERVTDPQISPDGLQVVYTRSGFDVMRDASRTALWLVQIDGTGQRALTDGTYAVSQPRWSPDGSRLLYVARKDDRSQIFVRWMDSGDSAQLTDLEQAPAGLSWSPDGATIAFSMFVPEPSPIIKPSIPSAPDGADWGPAWKVIDELKYRADGAGYLKEGFRHYFLLPAEGGSPRQVTEGPFNHGGTPQWTPDGRALVFSANRHENSEQDPNDSEIYRLDLDSGRITALTRRHGPDGSPSVSPDGKIAYTGFDDRYQGHQSRSLYVMDLDGSNGRPLLAGLDRSIGSPTWSPDGQRLYFSYGDQGTTRVAWVAADGSLQDIDLRIGGLSIGRPYSGGQFSVGPGGAIAFTHGSTSRPADLAVYRDDAPVLQLTRLNEDLLGLRELGRVEERRYRSSFDDRLVHSWVVTPPGFDPQQRYPLILEIHGGPFSAYGPHFSAEAQLYAAAGYVVLYTNPRGSTSYGEEFANLIHHAYPGNDYDDLMSAVDGLLAEGFVDPERLFVTGGSGGGVLSAWIVGKTDRFRAAVVQKPVINWYSFVLHADNPAFFYKYWFPGPPWEHAEHYMSRSPISLVGNVSTPTMLLTGEQDYRTPMSESEQYYAALKIRGVEAALVRVPDASHGIAGKPSNLIAKVAHVLAWFDRYGDMTGAPPAEEPAAEKPRGW